eukprot:TRINITY_DN12925_c0_g1_i2.p1 TRINITY_DN12925_c0_g1~~TRINITY_DN12925_c0_g1_i2.p1  ORF type:complete len:379 (+),score=89.12 TRINITY_DN12925_c0_g1_i2:46-1182(+)
MSVVGSLAYTSSVEFGRIVLNLKKKIETSRDVLESNFPEASILIFENGMREFDERILSQTEDQRLKLQELIASRLQIYYCEYLLNVCRDLKAWLTRICKENVEAAFDNFIQFKAVFDEALHILESKACSARLPGVEWKYEGILRQFSKEVDQIKADLRSVLLGRLKREFHDIAASSLSNVLRYLENGESMWEEISTVFRLTVRDQVDQLHAKMKVYDPSEEDRSSLTSDVISNLIEQLFEILQKSCKHHCRETMDEVFKRNYACGSIENCSGRFQQVYTETVGEAEVIASLFRCSDVDFSFLQEYNYPPPSQRNLLSSEQLETTLQQVKSCNYGLMCHAMGKQKPLKAAESSIGFMGVGPGVVVENDLLFEQNKCTML